MITLSDGVDVWNPRLVEGYEAGRVSQTLVRSILGSVDVSVSLRPARRRSGTLRVFIIGDDTTGAFGLFDALAEPVEWTFTHDDRDEWAMSFVVVGEPRIVLDPGTRKHWHLEIPYQEVSAA